MKRGKLLEELTWVEAESELTPETVIVVPLGAAAKEHGPHLRLNNDFCMAEYFKNRLIECSDVLIAPTVNYFYYPSFVEYPGSISLEQDVSTEMIVNICLSLSQFGPRRFYVWNTGISTILALQPASERLGHKGILLRYSNMEKLTGPVIREISEQEGGSHADEIETSMMLYIAPETVDMTKAVKDFDKTGTGRLSRERVAGLTHSPTGIWGDPSLATRDKGERIVQSLLAGLLNDIEELRDLPLPKIRC